MHLDIDESGFIILPYVSDVFAILLECLKVFRYFFVNSKYFILVSHVPTHLYFLLETLEA